MYGNGVHTGAGCASATEVDNVAIIRVVSSPVMILRLKSFCMMNPFQCDLCGM